MDLINNTFIHDTTEEIITVPKGNLFLQYPFSITFAEKLTLRTMEAIGCFSLEELARTIEGETTLYPSFCWFSVYDEEFETVNNTLFYYKNNRYFNLENITYEEIILSSLIYVLKSELKTKDTSTYFQRFLAEFVLESDFSNTLVSILKQEEFIKNYKKQITSTFVDFLENKNKLSHKEVNKIDKKNLLNMFEILEICSQTAESLIEQYNLNRYDLQIIINYLTTNLN